MDEREDGGADQQRCDGSGFGGPGGLQPPAYHHLFQGRDHDDGRAPPPETGKRSATRPSSHHWEQEDQPNGNASDRRKKERSLPPSLTNLPPPCGEPLTIGSRDFPRGQGGEGVSRERRADPSVDDQQARQCSDEAHGSRQLAEW